MTSSKAEYKLYYHGIDGRGHFVRVLFCEKNVPFIEINDPKELASMGYFKGQKNKGFPCFAPPFLVHGDLVLSQTNTVVRYVATQLGLLPKDVKDQFRADALMACIQDAAGEFGKNTENSVEERVKFLETRFNTWLSLFCDALGKNDFIFGGALSYADLCLFLLLANLNRRLGAEKYQQFVIKKHPTLDTFRQRIAKREGIKRLVELKKHPYGDVWKF
jgi:glutathione S-transferase